MMRVSAGAFRVLFGRTRQARSRSLKSSTYSTSLSFRRYCSKALRPAPLSRSNVRGTLPRSGDPPVRFGGRGGLRRPYPYHGPRLMLTFACSLARGRQFMPAPGPSAKSMRIRRFPGNRSGKTGVEAVFKPQRIRQSQQASSNVNAAVNPRTEPGLAFTCM